MTIPDYQSIMLPLLKLAQDEQEHSIRDAYEHVSEIFGLTEAEREELLPSGRQPIIENRVGWARTYMTKAGLLESTRRGHFRINSGGLEVLSRDPVKIDLTLLRQFTSFVEFQRMRKDNDDDTPLEEQEDSRTPRELLEYGHQRIRRDVAQEVLDSVKLCSPSFFERLVVELLVKMGYGGSRLDAGEAIGRTGDGGIDGIIKEDRLGLDVIYIQAKRWESNVGSSEIRNFVGSLVGHSASKGVVITTSDFSRDAREYARTIGHNVILVNGEMLAELMIDHNVGVTTEETYEVKKVDSDYFLEA